MVGAARPSPRNQGVSVAILGSFGRRQGLTDALLGEGVGVIVGIGVFSVIGVKRNGHLPGSARP